MPLILLIFFSALVVDLLGADDPFLADYVEYAEPVALISGALSVYLLLQRAFRRPKRVVRERADFEPVKLIVIDGSNVMYWRDNEPSIEPVKQVIAAAESVGYTPGVVFDANVGYLLIGRHANDAAMAKMLRLPKERVMVSKKGDPADRLILLAARDFNARVITNDRFRDWAEQFPEVREQGRLVHGDYLDGRLRLAI